MSDFCEIIFNKIVNKYSSKKNHNPWKNQNNLKNLMFLKNFKTFGIRKRSSEKSELVLIQIY